MTSEQDESSAESQEGGATAASTADPSNSEHEPDDIEGLDSNEDDSLGEYPIDTVLIRNETRTVFEAIRRIDADSFVMDPDFQRDFIWPVDKQSKLIESVLMRIPLPVFYLAEDEQGRMIVVDGLQRLSTFKRFLSDDLKLKLPSQTELHGKKFSELSAKLQNRIEDFNLILYVIDAKVPERALLDIFERVNSGEPLTRQQMRNCIHMGPATTFLKEEVSTDLFLKATGRSLDRNSMRDREFVNRFCAFYLLGIDGYKGDMDEFLAQGLRSMNEMAPEDLQGLSQAFRLSLANNFTAFGKHSFRKHVDPDANRSVLNASLWDVMSTGLAQYSSDVVSSRANALREAFYPMMSDTEFIGAITYGTNDSRRVQTRFQKVRSMLQGVFGADKD
jgi:hypothetical protein